MTRRWLPNEPVNEDTMGEALWLERNYWQQMQNAITAGIDKAFNG